MPNVETSFERKPQKWALLIGINEYPKLYSENQLKGCVNDVNAIEEVLLSERFNFPRNHVAKLINHEATRDGILTTFRNHLVENVNIQSGDVVIVYYSGHGSYIKDMHGDEESGYDQTIVPYDSGRRSAEEIYDITDDELALLLDGLSQRTQNINLFFDSCHSGTVLRGIQDSQESEAEGLARWIKPWLDEVPLQVNLPVPVMEGSRGMGPSEWLPLSDGYVLIAGCLSEERSREYAFQIGIPPMSRTWHGAMTYYLMQALESVGPETTYYDIWDHVRMNVIKKNATQHPQIEGAFERKVFGGAALPRKRYIEVVNKTAETVTLAAGLTLGATLGSLFAIYSQGTQIFDDTTARIATIRLIEVDAFASIGKIEEGDIEQVTIGAPAIEIKHDYGSMQMPVCILGDDPILDTMHQLISESSLLRLVSDENYPSLVTVQLGHPRNTLAGEQILILSGGQPLIAPIAPVAANMVRVKDNLEHIARYHNLSTIHNVDLQSKLNGKIKMRLLKVVGQDEHGQELLTPVERSLGGDIILALGELVILEIDNQSDWDLHATILDFNTEWQVNPIFPPPGAIDDVVPAKRFRRTNRLKVTLPLHQQSAFPGQPLLHDTVKVIATTERVNFRALWLPALRDSDRSLDLIEGAQSSLYQLMELAIGGKSEHEHAMRGLEYGADPVVKDWTTDTLMFFIIP